MPPASHETASKLAQLLADTIVTHAPHTARANAVASRESMNEWLDGLEAHNASLIGPFLARLIDATDPPAEIRALVEEAITPTQAFSALLTQIFAYQIAGTFIQSAGQPFFQGLVNDANTSAARSGIFQPVDRATIATAVARGLELGDQPTVTVPQWAVDQGQQLGISQDQVNLLCSIVGLPPALQELFELYRRGIIDIDRVKQGLREGDFRDDWIDEAIGLVHAWLTPLDFVRAAIQAQLPYADARAWAEKTGLDVSTFVGIDPGGTEATQDNFGLAFSIGGRPPGPQELERMALRGIIPWDGTGAGTLSFQQGIAESDVKTKWTGALRRLATYVPPPRQVGTLLEHGAITADQARKLWEEGGVPAELAAGYVYMTEQQHVGQDKLLAKGEITTGYFDGIFTSEQATELLGLLGYRADVAADILAIVDFRREIKAINSVVTRVGSLYENFKLTATDAKAALERVGVPAAQADQLLRTWDTLRIAPVRVPTVAELGKAMKHGTITEDQALQAIARLGFEPQDAAIVLSAAADVQIQPLPPAGSTVTG